MSSVLHLRLAVVTMVTASGLGVAVRGSIAHWIRGLEMWFPVVLVLWLMMLLVIIRRHLVHLSTLEVDIHSSFVVLGVVLESEFAAYLLDTGLDLLHMIGAVVTCKFEVRTLPTTQ